MPLRTRIHQLGKTAPVVAVLISDPDSHMVSGAKMVSQIYVLKPGVARLTQILFCEASLTDASEQLGVTLGSLSKHLKNSFGKTNTNHQTQLVRLLLLAPTRAGGG